MLRFYIRASCVGCGSRGLGLPMIHDGWGLQLLHGTGGIRLRLVAFWLGTGGWLLVLGTMSIGLGVGRSGIELGHSHQQSTVHGLGRTGCGHLVGLLLLQV